ncbi:MAG: RDD family protein, partial [Dehalococcoidia bacterium]|nr:RDD family protein [Dehalococcoidia bacterium]
MEEQKEGIAVEYAGFWIRLVAYIIDWIVIWIIDAILGAIFWMFTFPFWAWGWAAGWGEMAPPFWLTDVPM